jgi:hypothetical protein
MPAHPRFELVDEREVEALAASFGIEVISFAVMSNHLHVMLRTRPDVTTAWSPEEIVRRWRELFPKRRVACVAAEVLPAVEVVEDWRSRLSSLSWFMRCLCEPIARQANREDRCSGCFFEGRFSSLRLLDEAAVLACSVYVDLNPIRAGVAEVPEASQWTSAYERIAARPSDATESATPEAAAITDQDGWMAPIPLSGDSEAKATRNAGRRASNQGVFEMSLDEYLSVLDWTGRQLHPGKRRDGGGVAADPRATGPRFLKLAEVHSRLRAVFPDRRGRRRLHERARQPLGSSLPARHRVRPVRDPTIRSRFESGLHSKNDDRSKVGLTPEVGRRVRPV